MSYRADEMSLSLFTGQDTASKWDIPKGAQQEGVLRAGAVPFPKAGC